MIKQVHIDKHEEVKSPISQPYQICKDIKSLAHQLYSLSELPREGASLLLNYFNNDDTKRELDILASNLRAYKSNNKLNFKKNQIEVKSPKAVHVLHGFNVQVSNLVVKLIMIKEFETANAVFKCLKDSMYGLSRSSLFNNSACAKVLQSNFKDASKELAECEYLELNSENSIGIAINSNNRCVMLMKQRRYHEAHDAANRGVVVLEKLIKFPKLKSDKACAKMMRSHSFVQNLKLLLMSYYNLAQSKVKIGQSKDAEIIFNHGLLMSEKFFITNTLIAKKYKKRARLNNKNNKNKNFIQKNIKNAAVPVSKSPVKPLQSSSSLRSTRSSNHLAQIKTTRKHQSPTKITSPLSSSKVKQNKRVKSAFENSLQEMILAEKDLLKSSENEECESKATKATKALSSELSNKIRRKIASFTEEDIHKIMESIRNNTPSITKIPNWRDFADKQVMYAKGQKEKHQKCYACDN
ncbi:unnamed protein product [Moneuplotes crassus]|uniref:Uncharacterized protein n=1 Tax=Euplotes crassus TaxID=5936 RepID=A0AAD1UIA7_EUPCR|nr:unnamed protein product [Moneuplotes crassus]